jgi:hypothetical protein
LAEFGYNRDKEKLAQINLCLVADCAHSALEEKMRQAGLLRKMTVAEVLAQLRKIKAVRTRTGRRFLLEISKSSSTTESAYLVFEIDLLSNSGAGMFGWWFFLS